MPPDPKSEPLQDDQIPRVSSSPKKRQKKRKSKRTTTQKSKQEWKNSNSEKYRVCFSVFKPQGSRHFFLSGLAIKETENVLHGGEPHSKVSKFSLKCGKSFPQFLSHIPKHSRNHIFGEAYFKNDDPTNANKLENFRFKKTWMKGLFKIRRQIRFTLNQKFEEKKKWRVSGEVNFNAAGHEPNWKPFSSGSLKFPSSDNGSTKGVECEGASYECMAVLTISGKPQSTSNQHRKNWSWAIINIELIGTETEEFSPLLDHHNFYDKTSALIIDKEDNALLLEKSCTTDNFINLGFRLQHFSKTKEVPCVTDDELKGLTRKELKCLKDNSFQGENGTKLKFFSDQFWGGYNFTSTISGEKNVFCERIDKILKHDPSNEPGKHKLPRFEPNQRIFTLPGGKIDLISWEFDDTVETSLTCEITEETNLDARRMRRLTPEPISVTPVVPSGALLKSVFNSSLVHVYKCNLNLKESNQLKCGREFCGKKLVSIHSFEEDEELGGELNAPIRMVLKKVKEALFTESTRE